MNFDAELRERFGELRAHERQRVPEFRARAGARAREHIRARAWVAIAGAVAAVLAVVLLRPRSHEILITEWKAPTDVLLVLPNTSWISQMPDLHESIIDERLP
jgi:hypothetical protein